MSLENITPISPYEINSLAVDGAIFNPHAGVIVDGGVTFWRSSSDTDSPDVFSDAHVNQLVKPVLTEASNGELCWTLPDSPGPSSFRLVNPGLAFQFTLNGAYIFHARQASLGPLFDTQRYFFSQWRDGGPPTPPSKDGGRILMHSRDFTSLSVGISRNGGGFDSDPSGIGQRSKANLEALGDLREWHAFAIQWSVDESNFLSNRGTASSYKLKLYVDGKLIKWEGFSAPQSNNGGIPPAGPCYDLFASTWEFVYGAAGTADGSSGGISPLGGQVGPLLIANCDDTAELTAEEIRGLSAWQAPR